MYYIQRRNIAVCIILSLVTCGIYEFYWLYKQAEDINAIKNDPNATSPGLVVVLTLVTCGIYYIYWVYKAGETMDNVNFQRGLPTGNKAILYLLLSIFGLSIVAVALLQNDLNIESDNMNGGGDRFGGYGGQGGYGNPYGGQGGYGNPYGGQNQNPYGDPNSYGSQNPYGGQNQYGSQNQYGQSPFSAPQPQDPFAAPQQQDPYQAQNSYLTPMDSPFKSSGDYSSPFESQSGTSSGSMMDDMNKDQ